jgi:hypothetical protein
MHECFVVVPNTGVNNLAGNLLNLWLTKLAQKIKMRFYVNLWLTRLAQKI